MSFPKPINNLPVSEGEKKIKQSLTRVIQEIDAVKNYLEFTDQFRRNYGAFYRKLCEGDTTLAEEYLTETCKTMESFHQTLQERNVHKRIPRRLFPKGIQNWLNGANALGVSPHLLAEEIEAFYDGFYKGRRFYEGVGLRREFKTLIQALIERFSRLSKKPLFPKDQTLSSEELRLAKKFGYFSPNLMLWLNKIDEILYLALGGRCRGAHHACQRGCTVQDPVSSVA